MAIHFPSVVDMLSISSTTAEHADLIANIRIPPGLMPPVAKRMHIDEARAVERHANLVSIYCIMYPHVSKALFENEPYEALAAGVQPVEIAGAGYRLVRLPLVFPLKAEVIKLLKRAIDAHKSPPPPPTVP